MAFENLLNALSDLTNPTKKSEPIKDEVTVVVGGKRFDGWDEVEVSKNIESISHSFSISLFDRFEGLKQDWPIKPGNSVRIIINEKRVTTGFIEKLDVNFNSKQKTFRISGRSKPGDLVDCIHVGENEFSNIKFETLVETLIAPFGLRLFLSVTPDMVDKFATKPGETVFEAIDRAARLQGFFFISTPKGNIRLTKAPENEARFRADDVLEQDINILSASASYDDSQRHSTYIVKGQTVGLPDFFAEAAAHAEGSAIDAGVLRHRPFELIAEGKADSAACEKRAQWEASSRLARAIRINCRVQGWTQSTGELWDVNQLTRLKSPVLGLNRQMLIANTVQRDSIQGGKVTDITLIDPQAYKTEPVVNSAAADDIFAKLGTEFSESTPENPTNIFGINIPANIPGL